MKGKRKELEHQIHGKQRGEWKRCMHCGDSSPVNESFCLSCGLPFGTMQGKKESEREKDRNRKLEKDKGNIRISVIAACCFAAFLVLFVGVRVAVSRLEAGNSKLGEIQEVIELPVVYFKNNHLYGVLEDGEAYLVSSGIWKDETKEGIDQIADIQFTEDGKHIIYGKNSSMDGSGKKEYELYIREYGKKEAKEKKIDSRVVDFEIDDQRNIIYKKNRGYGNNTLYVLKDGSMEAVEENVGSFGISKNGAYIHWVKGDGLYVQDTSDSSRYFRIDWHTSSCSAPAFSNDYSQITYLKQGSLYLVEHLGSTEKICDSVEEYTVSGYREDGTLELYYSVSEPYDPRKLVYGKQKSHLMPGLSSHKIYHWEGAKKSSTLLEEGIVISMSEEKDGNYLKGRIYTLLDVKQSEGILRDRDISGMTAEEVLEELQIVGMDKSRTYIIRNGKIKEINIEVGYGSCLRMSVADQGCWMLIEGARDGEVLQQLIWLDERTGKVQKLDATEGQFGKELEVYGESLAYMKEWNGDCGNLYICHEGEVSQMEADVQKLQVFDGKLFFLTQTGKLGYCEGAHIKWLDDQVTDLLTNKE